MVKCEDCELDKPGSEYTNSYCETCGKNPTCDNCLKKLECGHFVCKGCKEFNTDGKICMVECDNRELKSS